MFSQIRNSQQVKNENESEGIKSNINLLYKLTNELNEKDLEIYRKEKIQENILNYIPDCIFIISKNGIIESMNKSARDLFDGKVLPGMIYTKISQFLDLSIDNCVITRTLKTFKTAVKNIKYTENEKIYSLISIPIFDDKNNLLNILLQFRDITDILESHNRFCLVVDEANMFYWDLDENYEQIILLKDLVDNMSSLPEFNKFSELVSLLSKVVHKDDIEKVKNKILNNLLFPNTTEFYLNFRIKNINGEYVWLFVKCRINKTDDFIDVNNIYTIKKYLKITGIVISDKKFNNIRESKNVDDIFTYIEEFTSLQLSTFSNDRNSNIKNMLELMKKQFNPNQIVYVKLKRNIAIPDNEEVLNNELEKLKPQFLNRLHESEHIYEESKRNAKDYFLLSFNKYSHAILILYFANAEKRKENLIKNNEILDLYINAIKNEENLLKISELNEFLKKKKIVWIEDDTGLIIKMNVNLKKIILKVIDPELFDMVSSYRYYFINAFPKCIKDVFSECSEKDLKINKNKRKFYLECSEIYIKGNKNKLFKIKRF